MQIASRKASFCATIIPQQLLCSAHDCPLLLPRASLLFSSPYPFFLFLAQFFLCSSIILSPYEYTDWWCVCRDSGASRSWIAPGPLNPVNPVSNQGTDKNEFCPSTSHFIRLLSVTRISSDSTRPRSRIDCRTSFLSGLWPVIATRFTKWRLSEIWESSTGGKVTVRRNC
jgi:hypothetical protein